eukprot:1005624-Prorocentrum_minimum.AAC.1
MITGDYKKTAEAICEQVRYTNVTRPTGRGGHLRAGPLLKCYTRPTGRGGNLRAGPLHKCHTRPIAAEAICER